MTLSDILGATLRRWYVIAAVALVAVVIAVMFVRGGGVYSTRTIVTFTLPSASALSQDNGNTDESVIAFAGAVATEINDGKPTPRYSTNDAPYYGAGVRQGVVVGLRDEGSQWAPSFGSAIIEIQIVGRTREWVKASQDRILARISETVSSQQQTAAAAADEQITAHVEPLTTRIEYVSASREAFIAAIGAIALATLIAGSWLVVVLDRIIIRRRARRFSQTAIGGHA